MNKTINLQDVFLNQCRKDKIMVTIILTNGFQFKGMVRGFDSYVAIFDCDGKQQLVCLSHNNPPSDSGRTHRQAARSPSRQLLFASSEGF